MAEPLSDDALKGFYEYAMTDLALGESDDSASKPAYKRDRDAWRNPDDDKNYESVPKPISIEWN